MRGLMSDTPLTLSHVFGRAERLFPSKTITTATAAGLERTTYGAWAERTRRLAGVFDDLGLTADARVATFAWNTARHLELYYAAPCSGRVLHTLNIRLFPEQVTYAVNHAEDAVIFVDRSLLALFWPLVPTFETVEHIVVMDDGSDAEIPDDARIRDYEELLAAAAPASFHIDDENRAAAMCYTSGTTGNPKGVVYSHRSMVLHGLGSMVADSLAVSERDTILPVVPMFHANAWGLAHSAVMAGANLVMPGPDLSAPAIAALMEGERVTLAAGVPTIWNGVIGELDGRDVSALDRIVCGGSAVPKALSEAYRERTGLAILQAWGMTETSPLGSVARIKSSLGGQHDPQLADLRATAGLPQPLVDVRIVEPDDRQRAALGRRGARRAAGERPVDRGRLLQRRALRRVVHRGRLAEDRGCRDDRPRGLHPARGPHEGPHQVRRRMDQLGRARERDHGPPAGARGRRRRRAGRALGRAPARVRRAGRRGRGDARRDPRVPHRPRAEVVAARADRAHRRGAEDLGRQVLQEGPARAVRGELMRETRIVIVGSGFGGLGTAIRLRQEGIEDFVVLEKADEVGGTWRENTYPGIACDVPSHLYSFSFAPNPGWSRMFSPGGEIQDYLVALRGPRTACARRSASGTR